jgi:hypothetical protein
MISEDFTSKSNLISYNPVFEEDIEIDFSSLDSLRNDYTSLSLT